MEYPLTNIHPNAKIGTNVSIEPFSTIYENVEIGDGTWIGPNVTIMPGARIGKNCKIHPGAVISGIPQDLKFQGEETLTFVGDNTVIRECVTISRGTTDRMQTVVGSDCLLMAYVHIAHDCIIGSNCILANAVQIAGHVVMGDYAILGGNSGVHQFVHIGTHSMTAGGSSVFQDIPPYAKAGRLPLKYYGPNIIGLRRRGFSADTIGTIKDIYHLIYFRGMNMSAAVDEVEKEFSPSPERDEIVSFIRNTRRGLIRGYDTGSAESI